MDKPSARTTHADFSHAPENRVEGAPERAVVTRRSTYDAGHRIEPHWHARAQFIFAVAGTMRVRTARHVWIVPSTRALWIPARTIHEVQMYGVVQMRSLYVNAAAAARMPSTCVVLNVTPLLKELIVRAVALPADYDEKGDDGLLMRLLMAGVRRLPPCALDLPLPASKDLMTLCERLLADL